MILPQAEPSTDAAITTADKEESAHAEVQHEATEVNEPTEASAPSDTAETKAVADASAVVPPAPQVNWEGMEHLFVWHGDNCHS